ncbi:hypothetical protein KI387_041893, partial [Taxus chinensis]
MTIRISESVLDWVRRRLTREIKDGRVEAKAWGALGETQVSLLVQFCCCCALMGREGVSRREVIVEVETATLK